MGQPKELVYNFLFKSKYTNAEDFCEIIKSYHQIKDGIDNTDLFKLLGQDYKLLVQDCSELILQDTFDIDNYILKNNLNRDLVYRINNLLIKDQRFRKNLFNENTTDQQLLDKENILEAESILKEYGYPGLSIVGKKFDYVIWIMIQHADLHYQEKYLPLIALAVEQGELEKIPLKMLIDRIYHRKTGKQIFGSQAGIPFADDSTIEEVKLKYKL
ncbi:MAG: hypothetical protein EBR30_15040 [Cytophagia bacterium]|nr:hypothetical protein [Cytophagia bacterium]